MLKIYETNAETKKIEQIEEFRKGCWINLVNPSEEEIQTVCENLQIQDDFIRYALDYEEKARIDTEEDDNTLLFVIDTPTIEKKQEGHMYTTAPLGMIIVRDDFFITISLKTNRIIKEIEKNKIKNVETHKKSRLVLQILYANSSLFLEYLKQINKESEIAEHTLKNTTRNEELIKLMNLEKGLVYFTTSLRSNEVVMEKTMRGKIMKLYEDDEDLLEDAIIENRQAIEMAKIYNDILNSTMDTYASIISNNLNDVMKFLTSITVILAVPTMVASFWGMNVPLPYQHHALGFVIMVAISALITFLVTIWLKRKDLLN